MLPFLFFGSHVFVFSVWAWHPKARWSLGLYFSHLTLFSAWRKVTRKAFPGRFVELLFGGMAIFGTTCIWMALYGWMLHYMKGWKIVGVNPLYILFAGVFLVFPLIFLLRQLRVSGLSPMNSDERNIYDRVLENYPNLDLGPSFPKECENYQHFICVLKDVQSQIKSEARKIVKDFQGNKIKKLISCK